MPRRAYIAELNSLTKSVSIPGILHIRPGDDDGEFKVTVSPDNGASRLVISGLIPDLGEYPSSHSYHLFVDDDAPAHVGKTLEKLPDMSGHDLSDLLRFLSKAFLKVDGEGDSTMMDSQELDGTYDDFEAEVEDEEDDIFILDRPPAKMQLSTDRQSSGSGNFSSEQIRADLRLTHNAGFKVGYHGSLLEGGNCYVAISCRVSKLGISEEALQAWELNGNEYLVLLIHYPAGYKTLEQLKALDPYTARSYVSFRVGVMKDGKAYKPSLSETIRAFRLPTAREESQPTEPETLTSASVDGWRDIFISKPLNLLFNERFLNILKYRYMGMPWQGAERFYNDVQGKNYDIGTSDYLDSEYTDDEVTKKTFPRIVMADHLKEAPPGFAHAFPLLAIQFLLRHFVRCTDFCLVCHCKLEDDLEAIKPYVCNKELCLFQYMNLGFGPSIEHEIMSQPYVVDLLISFCYTSAVSSRLQEFPSGLGLHVPPPHLNERPAVSYNSAGSATAAQNANKAKDEPKDPSSIEARYDEERNELIFPKASKCPLRAGKWVALRYVPNGETDDDPQTYHGRVLETNYWPIVKLSALRGQWPKLEATEIDDDNKAKAKKAELKKLIRPVYVWNYDVDFDTLKPHNKTSTILALLERLPPVKEMRDYLLSHKNASLDRWKDRMPDACLQVLRWVIASNRACIVQVDKPENADGESADGSNKRSEERLYGMKGWMQFRFAMGAPDKERRFLDAVQDTAQRLTLKYPTIFAWHGSPMQNWHSIIREGLHFKDTLHGRAYGHGVYFSTDFNVSHGYSQYGPRAIPTNCWPNSELKISSAMSLNEIVNAPAEFVSQTPYLVVAQLDWIQTRYLFVKVNNEDWKMDEKKEAKPSDVFAQDPARRPVGASDKVEIPITAISSSRRGKAAPITKVDGGSKKKLKYSGSVGDPIYVDDDDDNISVMTEPEDRAILVKEVQPPPTGGTTSKFSDVLSFGGLGNRKGKQSLMDGVRSFISGSKHSVAPLPPKPLTDFVPGQLDYSALPILPPPPFATPIATKRLQRDYQTLLKVQNSTPPHELGWYTDPERFGDNVYQWIVELHSFDETLPLARQMKERGFKSVVLEMRFGASYPMEPPFVRVVRPRFLAFQQGGGGHVTAGGSICMELLTNSGWSAASSIESVLLQVRMAISSRDPKPAQLEAGSRADAGYGVGEAISAYIRACNVHGWRAPQGFKEMALGGEPAGGKGYY